MTEVNVVEGPIEKVNWEMGKVIRWNQEDSWTFRSVEMTNAVGDIGIDTVMKLCQCVLDGTESQRNGTQVWQHQPLEEKGMWWAVGNIEEWSYWNLLWRIRNAMKKLKDVQIGFMPGKGTTDALFIFNKDTRGILQWRKRSVHVLCGSWSCREEGSGVGNDEEKFTRDNGDISDESWWWNE